jgi:hypothetical protein
MASSFCATKYHDGCDFQAGMRMTSVKAVDARGCCTAYMTLASAGSTSPAKWLTKSSSESQAKPRGSVKRCSRAGVTGPCERSAPSDSPSSRANAAMYEADDVWSVCSERSHDLAAIGVPDDDRRAVLELEHLAQPCDVVGERAHGELGRPYLEAICLEAPDDAAPAGPIGPGAMDENNVWPAVHCRPLPCLESWNAQCRQTGAGRASHDPAI